MPYVQRSAGKVIALYGALQSGFAEEWLDDNAQEIVDFLNPPDAVAEAARQANLSSDGPTNTLVQQLKTATAEQIRTWITNNVTTLAQAREVLIQLAIYLARR